ncbi:MAG TPA: efflux RND transporter periplasmic adaptor subunit [Cytophagaceae bacterium]|jgi:membrane fusion protein (multidrug efflux system)
MTKAKPYIIAGGIILFLLLLKFQFFPGGKLKGGKGSGKGGKNGATPVSVFVVGKSSLQNNFYTSGTILPNEEAELKAEATGRVTYLNLPEGSYVKAGTLLLKVNDSDVKAQFSKITTQLKMASVAEARQKKLLHLEGISAQDYDIALSNLNVLKSDSAYHRALLSKTEIYAPFDGIIGIRNVSHGGYLTPATTVAKILQINPIKIDFSLPEKYSSLLTVGDLIKFKTEGLADVFTAKLTVRDPQVDVGSRSVRYRAVCNNPKAILLPGSFARVEIDLKENSKSLFVPTEAIVPVLKGRKVFVVKNGKAEQRMVETGLRTDDHVQVISGLQVNDSVVVNGNFQLKDGADVKVSGAKKIARK